MQRQGHFPVFLKDPNTIMRRVFLLLLLFALLTQLLAQDWIHPEPKILSPEQVVEHGISAVQEYESVKKLGEAETEQAGHVFTVIKYPKSRTEFNAQGKVIRKITYNTQTGAETNASYYRYNSQGLLEQLEETTYFGIEVGNVVDRGEFTHVSDYKYDAQGRCIHKVVRYKGNSVKQEEEFYTWNSANQLLQVKSWHLIDGYCDGNAEYMLLNSYSYKGQQVNIDQISLDPKTEAPANDPVRLNQKEELTFTSQGQLSQHITRHLISESFYSQEYLYRKDRLYKIRFFTGQPAEQFLEEEYFYNAAGLPVMIRSSGENSEMDGLEKVFEYFYEDE